MTAFYAPTDLRDIDPRPTAAPSASDEDVVRTLLEYRLSGDELTRALQALGMLPYDRVLNESGRDAWARRASRQYGVKRERDERSRRECPRGHARSVHAATDSRGRVYCMTCKAADGELRRREAAERRKQAAA